MLKEEVKEDLKEVVKQDLNEEEVIKEFYAQGTWQEQVKPYI